MIVLDPLVKQWLELLTAGATLLAAICAAISAWTSSVSARAARDAVKDARLARHQELAPRLILEKDFFDFQFHWPHRDSLNGEAVFLSRKHWQDKAPAPPTFTLQNFGQSPALEVTIVWELDDPNGDFDLPTKLVNLGLSVEDFPTGDVDGKHVYSLFYKQPNGTGAGIPLYRKWTTDISNCSPGQQRVIEFPTPLLNTLFLRGLQQGSTMPDKEITLTARITCFAVDGTRYDNQFRWKAIPFHHGQVDPIVVFGHFFELPIYPKPDGPRAI